MAINEMDARLISQGAETTAIGSSALVSVSDGAGQPQKNIQLGNFADSMAKAVPQKTKDQVSITGLYAKTTDGKIVELTSDSVASVVAELLGNPAGTKGYTTKDMNVLVANGIYYCNNMSDTDPVGNLHYPSSNSRYWLLNVSVTNGKVVQTAHRIGNTNVECYSRDGDTAGYWSSWTRIDNFGYNSLADLAGGVAGVIKYITPIELTSESSVGKIYRIKQSSANGVNVLVSIVHPFYGSLTSVFIPTNPQYEVLSSNLVGTYRGRFGMYKDGGRFYVKIKESGADRLSITSTSLIGIELEDVTSSVDESTLVSI